MAKSKKNKKVSIAQVLTITTGIHMCVEEGFGGVYDILNFMTREDLYTHELPAAGDRCKEPLHQQLPWLEEVRGIDPIAYEGGWEKFMIDMTEKYGKWHTIVPLERAGGY